jgi:perosamine synthetase
MIPVAVPLIGEDERAAVDRVLRSGMLAQGAEVEAFEKEFSGLVDGRACIAVNSGTSALHLGMLAAGVTAGDEVIVPSFTFAATANAVRLCGAVPVFVDIDPGSYCLDPAAVLAALSPRTVAVLAVHLFGHPADLVALAELCADKQLLLVEDAAQAHAASLAGRPVGAWGDVAAFSFYPTKNMTTGEGGMIVTPDADRERMCRLLRNQGMERRYQNEVVGFNTRMTEVAAAIGRVQLGRLSGWNDQRRRNAQTYDAGLRAVDTPVTAPGAVHVYHQYTVRSPERDALAAHLQAAGVGSGVYYPTPVHELASYGLSLDLPVTAAACAQVLSLPVGPHLTDADVATVVEAINSFTGSGS